MSSVNNTNGPVDFWANLKKQKEEEARQREQEARELAMPFDVQQDEIDNLPEPEPDDDMMESEVVQEPTGDDEKEIISDGNTEESEDEIGEEELIKLVKISARINKKVDEVMKDMAKEFDMSKYEFAIRETQTKEVIQDVSTMKSEVGVLYLSDFNRKSMTKLFHSAGLEFHHLTICQAYLYLWKGHPLANEESISFEQLGKYPCLAFEQGDDSAFYLAEEILSTNEYPQIIKANDRATMLNLMIGLNGYTLCSGIICEELNGSDYCAVKLDSNEVMTIGYLARKGTKISRIGQQYLAEISKFRDKGLL